MTPVREDVVSLARDSAREMVDELRNYDLDAVDHDLLIDGIAGAMLVFLRNAVLRANGVS
jgi:hypothetical protein